MSPSGASDAGFVEGVTDMKQQAARSTNTSITSIITSAPVECRRRHPSICVDGMQIERAFALFACRRGAGTLARDGGCNWPAEEYGGGTEFGRTTRVRRAPRGGGRSRPAAFASHTTSAPPVLARAPVASWAVPNSFGSPLLLP